MLGLLRDATLDSSPTMKKRFSYLWKASITNKAEGLSSTEEYYLAALVVRDRKEELIPLLEGIDITKVQSVNLTKIFNSLGRLSLESLAEKLVVACKTSDYEVANLSQFICCYAISLPNLASREVVSKFRYIHRKHELLPTSSSYKKLVSFFCESFKVYTALDVVKEILEEGITLSLEKEIIHSILYACDESCEYHLVDQIYALISQHDLKPTSETFRRMINLRVKMKDVSLSMCMSIDRSYMATLWVFVDIYPAYKLYDFKMSTCLFVQFEGAYAMLHGLEKTDALVTSSMYNAIMAGFLREVTDIVLFHNLLKDGLFVYVVGNVKTFFFSAK